MDLCIKDQSTGGLTEHASKLSLSKGWHFNPVSPKCLKLGTHDLLLMGNKKVSRTHNVTSMDISRQWQFVNNLKKMTSNQPLIQLSVQCCVHVWNTCQCHVNFVVIGMLRRNPPLLPAAIFIIIIIIPFVVVVLLLLAVTFKFSHLADAFVQSDVQGREQSSYEQ